MGMFDSIRSVPLACPRCRHRFTVECQTKDLGCWLDAYTFGVRGLPPSEWGDAETREEKQIEESRLAAAESALDGRDGETFDALAIDPCPRCGLEYIDAVLVAEGGVFAKVLRVSGQVCRPGGGILDGFSMEMDEA